MKLMPQIAGPCQRGFVSRGDCSLTNVKAAGGDIEKIVHTTKQFLEQGGNMFDGKKRWANMEQGPEQGRGMHR